MRERKELIPNGAVDSVVFGGIHRRHPRAGASRAISLGDGISNGCVDVYVRCCNFLLKRTQAVALREAELVEGEMGDCFESRSESGRSEF